MAKGQLRGNREYKKPKQPKPAPASPPVGLGGTRSRPSEPGKTTKR